MLPCNIHSNLTLCRVLVSSLCVPASQPASQPALQVMPVLHVVCVCVAGGGGVVRLYIIYKTTSVRTAQSKREDSYLSCRPRVVENPHSGVPCSGLRRCCGCCCACCSCTILPWHHPQRPDNRLSPFMIPHLSQPQPSISGVLHLSHLRPLPARLPLPSWAGCVAVCAGRWAGCVAVCAGRWAGCVAVCAGWGRCGYQPPPCGRGTLGRAAACIMHSTPPLWHAARPGHGIQWHFISGFQHGISILYPSPPSFSQGQATVPKVTLADPLLLFFWGGGRGRYHWATPTTLEYQRWNTHTTKT